MVVVDEDGVAVRGLTTNAEEGLEVCDFLEGRGTVGRPPVHELWRPYLLCNMDNAAA
jgi:hypothetical protein